MMVLTHTFLCLLREEMESSGKGDGGEREMTRREEEERGKEERESLQNEE